MKKITILFLLILGIQACEDIGCNVDCFSPPPTFAFELVDKITGENLFSNGTLNSANIKLVDENNENTSFEFISTDNLNIINIQEIGWNMGFHTYTLSVGDTVEFEIALKMEEKNENCCTFFKIIQFNITNYTYEKSNTTDIYKVQID